MPQLESLASFSAVIDRLGEFEEVINAPKAAQATAAQPGLAAAADSATNGSEPAQAAAPAAAPAAASAATDPSQHAGATEAAAALARGEHIQMLDEPVAAGSGNTSSGGGDVLLELQGVTLRTPDGSATLVQNLDLQVC